VDAIGEVEAGDDFDILGLRKDGAAFARLNLKFTGLTQNLGQL
jgi:hypothetical protein